MTTPFEPPGSDLRAGDADRRRTTETLARAWAAGEISSDEHTERAARAAAARTRRELAALTADIAPEGPSATQVPALAAAPAPYEQSGHWVAALAAGWRSWAGVAVLLTVVWGLASLAAGHLTQYWPVWPLGLWGAGLIIRGVRRSGDDH